MTTSAFPRGVDTEALLVGAVGDVLRSVPVSTRVPNPRPDRFVKVTRTGGQRDRMVIDTSTFSVEVWAAESPDAVSLALDTQKTICDLEGVVVAATSFIVEASCTNPRSFPDPDTDVPRYIMTASLVVHTH